MPIFWPCCGVPGVLACPVRAFLVPVGCRTPKRGKAAQMDAYGVKLQGIKKPRPDRSQGKKVASPISRAGCFGLIVHEIVVNIPGINERAAAVRDNPHARHFPQFKQRGGVSGAARKRVTMVFYPSHLFSLRLIIFSSIHS